MNKFQVTGASIYSRLFDKTEEGTLEVPPVGMKGSFIKKLPGAPNFYAFSKTRVLVCYIHCRLLFFFVTELH